METTESLFDVPVPENTTVVVAKKTEYDRNESVTTVVRLHKDRTITRDVRKRGQVMLHGSVSHQVWDQPTERVGMLAPDKSLNDFIDRYARMGYQISSPQ